MLKPTHHYEDLRKALQLYWYDDYESPMDCWAHVLLDVRIWIGNTKQFYEAVRKSADLAIEQHEKAVRELDNLFEQKGE